MTEKIGILHTGGLRELTLALPNLSRFHSAYKTDDITLITTRSFVDIASRTGYFNAVWDAPIPDSRSRISWMFFKFYMRRFGFDHIYYIGPEAPPVIKAAPLPKTDGPVLKDWCDMDMDFYQLPRKFALIHIGTTSSNGWSATRKGTFCKKIVQDKIMPVLIGRNSDSRYIERLEKICPEAQDFSGQIGAVEMTALARQAKFVFGEINDDFYLTAFAGCPAVCLVSDQQETPEPAPKADKVIILQDDLDHLSVNSVYSLMQEHGIL